MGDAPKERWSYALVLIPFTGVVLALWLLVVVSQYPHNDITATYASGIGWIAIVANGWFTFAAVIAKLKARVIVAIISLFPTALCLLGLAAMADANSPS